MQQVPAWLLAEQLFINSGLYVSDTSPLEE